jgi:hypothetical protein
MKNIFKLLVIAFMMLGMTSCYPTYNGQPYKYKVTLQEYNEVKYFYSNKNFTANLDFNSCYLRAMEGHIVTLEQFTWYGTNKVLKKKTKSAGWPDINDLKFK